MAAIIRAFASGPAVVLGHAFNKLLAGMVATDYGSLAISWGKALPARLLTFLRFPSQHSLVGCLLETPTMFDPSKTLNENLIAFRTACDQIDAECAKILFDNIDTLRASGPDRNARQTFNSCVKLALEQLPEVEVVAH